MVSWLEKEETRVGYGIPTANDSNSQAGTGEWLSLDDLLRQAEGGTQFADLVLVEVLQWLDDSSLNSFFHFH